MLGEEGEEPGGDEGEEFESQINGGDTEEDDEAKDEDSSGKLRNN